MKHTLELISMNKVWYTGEWYDCYNELQRTPQISYELNCVEKGIADWDNKYYKLTLYTENGSCSSGYCNATWGCFALKEVKKFGAYTHTPKEKGFVFEFDDEVLDFNCKYFNIDSVGGDDYYPEGFVSVAENLFIANKRYIDKPTCLVFFGKSGVGKSFLAERLNGMLVYETDTNTLIPDNICADVVVVGNKYKHSYKDVVKHISPEYRIVLCGMEEITDNYEFYN